MATAPAAIFTGFEPEAIQFLVDLADNNNREWFQPRKREYERLLKEPLEALCVALDAEFRTRGLPLMADPARSPFRIYRDVRFSKDKAPYKTAVSASFPWVADGAETGSHSDEHGNPGGYFHMGPGEVFVGGGMWHPPTAKLTAFRQAVVANPDALRAVLDDPEFKRRFGTISGENKLKRVPPGYPADHPEADLLKQKDLTFGERLADSDVLSPALPTTVAESFEAAAPLMRYLATV